MSTTDGVGPKTSRRLDSLSFPLQHAPARALLVRGLNVYQLGTQPWSNCLKIEKESITQYTILNNDTLRELASGLNSANEELF